MRLSRSSLRSFSALLAAGALVVAETASAQVSPPCLTDAELNSLITFALPVVMDSTMQTCRPQLAADGWFATKGPALVQSYAVRKSAAWPAARAALLKIGGEDDKMKDIVGKLPDSALQPFAEGMVAQLVQDGIKPGQCVAIERATRLLAPLPPENTSELISFVITLADKPKPGKKASLPICTTRN